MLRSLSDWTRQAGLVFSLLLPAAALLPGASRQPVEVTTREHVAFSPGGVIHVDASYGDLYVEGRDQAGVDLSVTKSMPFDYKPAHPERARERLDALHIVAQLRSEKELEVSTHGSRREIGVETLLQVPRNTRLVIRHGVGLISISDVTGDIQASCRRGDILLWMPETGRYSIDAKTRLGIVSSDLDGESRPRLLVGRKFSSTSQATAPQRLLLRMGFGGITIKPMLPEAYPTRLPVVTAR